MLKKAIVWGACWFNEPTDTVVNFFTNTILSLTERGFDVYPVLFNARYDHTGADNIKIQDSIKNIIIINNHFNVFPNKNYGVAAISAYALKLRAKYLAIVDPDWDVKEFTSFLDNLVTPLVNGDFDIIIPDIGIEAGRSNLFIGKTTMSLFYPEFLNKIKTPFPGSLIGLTESVCSTTLSFEYHYDWGGEWDIISYSILKNYRIGSMPIDVSNVRHRANTSKMCDAYQIWRAILGNADFVNRYSNMYLFDKTIEAKDDFSKVLLEGNLSSREQIDFVIANATNKTQKQLLYMVLYPLASILGEIDHRPIIQETDLTPYEKEEIGYVSELASYCVKTLLLKSSLAPRQISERANKMTHHLWGDWNKDLQHKALEEVKRVIG